MISWYRFEPLTDIWPNPTPAHERRSRGAFKATFATTLNLLEREIRMLDPNRPWDATAVVMQVACRPGDVRRDGGIRADARTFGHPGVRITFETPKYGRLSYGTDSCELWQHNVRSIALGLEALRAVDRYGISDAGQQYTGFKALPAGRAMPASHMTGDQAREIVTSIVGPIDRPWDTRFKLARAEAHPDRNDGDRTLWDQVEQAGKVLGLL